MFCNATHNRKKSAELIAVQAFIPKKLSRNYKKSQVGNLVKKYAELFLGGRCEKMLDTFFRFQQETPYLQGEKPIVNLKNETLCRELNRSKSTIKRTLRKLSDHGLIAYRDSANGKRYKDWRTGERFGIDLTPMFERIDEIAALIEQEEQRLQREQDLKRKIKALEKSLQHCVEDVSSNSSKSRFAVHLDSCRDLQDQVKLIKDAAMTLQERCEAFEILHAKSEEILIDAYSGLNSLCAEIITENAKMGLKGIKNEPHHYNLDSAYLNGVCTKTKGWAVAPRRADLPLVFEDLAPEQKALVELEKRLFAFENKKLKRHRNLIFGSDEQRRKDERRKCNFAFIDVKAAVTNFQVEFGEVNSFLELVSLIPEMKVAMGLHQHAIELGKKKHNLPYVAVCMALAIEKRLREPEKIRTVAGYAVSLFKLDKRSATSKITRTLKHLVKS